MVRWGQPGRRPVRHPRRRGVRRDLRRDRRPPVPRDHRLPALRRTATGSTRSRSGRAASRSGARCSAARSGWCTSCGASTARALAVRRLRRARAVLRAGDRPVGQLVQPGAVRQARPACRGASRSRREHRPAGYVQYATFHPTFLYESIYCLLGGIALLWIDKRFRLRARASSPRCTSSSTRLVDSSSRTCASTTPTTSLGLRVNAWVSVVLFVLRGAVVPLARPPRRGRRRAARPRARADPLTCATRPGGRSVDRTPARPSPRSRRNRS